MVKLRANLTQLCGKGLNSLLHMAAFNNDIPMCEYLLREGLSPDFPNKEGVLPYALAKDPVVRKLLAPSA